MSTLTFLDGAGATKHRQGLGTGADSSNGFSCSYTGLDVHDAAATSNPIMAGGYASAAAPTSVSADGDAVNAWYLRNGAAATVITCAGALVGGDATNGLDVDVTRVIPGTSATHLGKAEDAAHTSGDVGVFVLAVRSDTAASLGQTDGDYTGLVTDSTGRLWCNVSNTVTVGEHHVTNAGTFAVQVDGSALTALQLIDDTIYTDDAAFTPGTSKIIGVGFEADEGSTDSVDEGDIGAARMTLDRKQIVTVQPHTAGGLSLFRSLDLDETEEDIKTSAGCLYKLRITNFSTSIRYVKLYNATAASTTVGSTTPIDTIPVPGATSATQPTVITENFGGVGLTFDTALCAAATTALADADTGAPSANDVVVSAYYK